MEEAMVEFQLGVGLGQEEADLELVLPVVVVVEWGHLFEYLDSNQEHSTQVRKDMFRNLHSYMYK
jgi:hypothetical protein